MPQIFIFTAGRPEAQQHLVEVEILEVRIQDAA
jgi:hypothetical protein